MRPQAFLQLQRRSLRVWWYLRKGSSSLWQLYVRSSLQTFSPNCSCGSNCTCGPSCQCGTKHGESLPKSMTKGMHAPLEGSKDEGRGLAHAEKTK
ncbi:TNFR-Cys domain-containing protein [Balamuthia mandrillaris]